MHTDSNARPRNMKIVLSLLDKMEETEFLDNAADLKRMKFLKNENKELRKGKEKNLLGMRLKECIYGIVLFCLDIMNYFQKLIRLQDPKNRLTFVGLTVIQFTIMHDEILRKK